MTVTNESAPAGPELVECRGPFDFRLSLRAMRSFGMTAAQLKAAHKEAAAGGGQPQPGDESPSGGESLCLGVLFGDRPTLLEIREAGRSPAAVVAEARPAPQDPSALLALAARVVNADLDLQPFYDLAAGHPVFGPLTRTLYGTKAFRPASLFDMLVIAVIEQQISLLAARSIHSKLVARFGSVAEDEPVSPAPEVLAAASITDLMACGLSERKAEYVSGLARQVVEGTFDLDSLETAPTDEVKARIVALRGFGPWSADYVLIRGLARPDSVPVDDLGIRTVVGRLMGDGSRPSAEQVTEMLAPLAPYRGLAAFYLLVAARLQ